MCTNLYILGTIYIGGDRLAVVLKYVKPSGTKVYGSPGKTTSAPKGSNIRVPASRDQLLRGGFRNIKTDEAGKTVGYTRPAPEFAPTGGGSAKLVVEPKKKVAPKPQVKPRAATPTPLARTRTGYQKAGSGIVGTLTPQVRTKRRESQTQRQPIKPGVKTISAYNKPSWYTSPLQRAQYELSKVSYVQERESLKTPITGNIAPGAKAFVAGIGKGVVGSLSAIAHPIDTGRSLVQVMREPRQFAQQLGTELKLRPASTSGEIVGSIYGGKAAVKVAGSGYSKLKKFTTDRRLLFADVGEMVPLKDRITQVDDILGGRMKYAVTSRPSQAARKGLSNVQSVIDPDYSFNVPHRWATYDVDGSLPSSRIFLKATQGRVKGIPAIEILEKGKSFETIKLPRSMKANIRKQLLKTGKLDDFTRKYLFEEAQVQATKLSVERGRPTMVATLSPKRTAGFIQPEMEMSLVAPKGKFKGMNLKLQGVAPEFGLIYGDEGFRLSNLVKPDHYKGYFAKTAMEKESYLKGRPVMPGEYGGHGYEHSVTGINKQLKRMGVQSKDLDVFKYHDISKVADVDSFSAYPHGETAGKLFKRGILKPKSYKKLSSGQQAKMSEAFAGHEYYRPSIKSLFTDPRSGDTVIPNIKQVKYYAAGKKNPYLRQLATADRLELERYGINVKKEFLAPEYRFALEGKRTTPGITTPKNVNALIAERFGMSKKQPSGSSYVPPRTTGYSRPNAVLKYIAPKPPKPSIGYAPPRSRGYQSPSAVLKYTAPKPPSGYTPPRSRGYVKSIAATKYLQPKLSKYQSGYARKQSAGYFRTPPKYPGMYKPKAPGKYPVVKAPKYPVPRPYKGAYPKVGYGYKPRPIRSPPGLAMPKFRQRKIKSPKGMMQFQPVKGRTKYTPSIIATFSGVYRKGKKGSRSSGIEVRGL